MTNHYAVFIPLADIHSVYHKACTCLTASTCSWRMDGKHLGSLHKPIYLCRWC